MWGRHGGREQHLGVDVGSGKCERVEVGDASHRIVWGPSRWQHHPSRHADGGGQCC